MAKSHRAFGSFENFQFFTQIMLETIGLDSD